MFHQFFGENMLRADVCNAVDELGQAAGPHRPGGRQRAQRRRASSTPTTAFSSPTAPAPRNKIVWHHTVAPGDVVVVDRNCHKSILHSIIMTGAIPVFMKPTRNHFGIIGPIPQERVRTRRDQGQDQGQPAAQGGRPGTVKPRVMTLTQSTYDGVLYNTETIKNMLDGYVDTLHFDEAWLPHAAFHPFYGTYHAMGKNRARPQGLAGVLPRSPPTSCWPASARPATCWCRTPEPQAGPAPVQRSVPDAHLHQPAVRHHRQLRRGGRDDGAARRHRAGGGVASWKRWTSAAPCARWTRNTARTGGSRSGAPTSWSTRASAAPTTGSSRARPAPPSGTASATWPRASTCWTRSSPPSSPRDWT